MTRSERERVIDWVKHGWRVESVDDGTDLSNLDLSNGNFRYFNDKNVDFTNCNLTGADFYRADLRSCYLRGAILTNANLAGAKMPDGWRDVVRGLTPISKSHKLLERIRAIVLENPDRLDMDSWHGASFDKHKSGKAEVKCGTTHCLAGWAQVLCPSTRDMEPEVAGSILIPEAAHLFYVEDWEALEWLEKRGWLKGDDDE